jgi:hypothetical protein
MGFGNARERCKSTEEHECGEDDGSLHLDLTPFISHHLRGRHPLGVRLAASNFGKNAQVRVASRQPDCHRDAGLAALERITVKRDQESRGAWLARDSRPRK